MAVRNKNTEAEANFPGYYKKRVYSYKKAWYKLNVL